MSPRTAPDPSILPEGDAQLERALEDLDRRLQNHLDSWADELDTQVTTPLRACLSELVASHAGLMEQAGLLEHGEATSAAGPHPGVDGLEDPGHETPHGSEGGEAVAEAAPACPDWSCLREYRNGVAHSVVAPLLRFLEEHRLAERAAHGWQGFVLGLRDTAAALPAEVVRTEPLDLFRPTDEDGPIRRVRKAAVRFGRGVTGIFGSRGPRAQTVHLREVARTALRGEGLPGMISRAEELHRHHAASVLEVEMALGRWLREWFPVEDPHHTVLAHLPPEVRLQLHRIRDLDRSDEREPSTGPEPEARAEESPAADADEAASRPPQTDAASEGGESADPARIAADLQSALEGAAARLSAPDEVVQRVRSGMDALGERLEQRIRFAGTGFDRPPGASEDRRLERLRERLATGGERWQSWAEVAENRVRLTHEVLHLRQDLDRELGTLFRGSLDASVLHLERWLGQARDGLLKLRDEAADPGSPLMATSDREAVAAATETYLERARAVLSEGIDRPLESVHTAVPLRELMDATVDRIDRRIRLLSSGLEVQSVRTPTPPPDPEQATRTIPIREAVRQPLGALRLEELRTSVAPLATFLEETRATCREIPNVVSYNLEAAREELLQESPPSDGADGEAGEIDDEALLEDARSLTLQGLERTAAAVDAALAASVDPFLRFSSDAHALVHRALVQAHDRITMERAVQEQIRDVRTLVTAWVGQGRERLDRHWQALRRWGEREGRKRYLQLQRLIRKGRSAVGADAGGEGEAERAMEVLRNIPELLEPLPLVYRRLFSFQPVTDPALLVGRDDETAWVLRRWSAWQDGLRTPSLLKGPVSVGHTSFLNVLSGTVFRDARVVRLVFSDRCASPDAVADRVAGALRDAEILPEAGGPWTLDRLGALLLERRTDPDAPPLVILVEHVAHLLMRIPGGAGPLERFLDFQARTSPAVFWLSTASDPFWKLVRKTEPRAAALVTVGDITAMDRAELESMLMVRHQRSGVPLEFLTPSSPNPLLKRKLQRTRSDEDRQALLREEFFDRLHRGSQGNMIMAILLWLKSADFRSREGWLRLRPPRPLRFAFLEEVDLDVDFGLMALLEHASLTLGEFARIFGMEEDQAYQTLEVLRSRMLLDRLSTQGGLPEAVETIRDGERYRVPPILAQVVSQYLRNHNILH